MALISVIVPVYKVEPYLPRCVDSILHQTYQDFELILVDDGSPDKCGEICDEYAQKDNRIVVIHQQNGGLSAARNAGIDWAFANSDSQWLTFIDSDDWVHPMYLTALKDCVDKTGADVAVCAFERTNGEEPVVDEQALDAVLYDMEELFCTDNTTAVTAWAKLYRKVLLAGIRYPKGKIHEDEFITYQILFKNEKIPIIHTPLYFYYSNTAGIMHTSDVYKRIDVLEAFENQVLFFNKQHKIRAYKFAVNRYIYHLIYFYSVVSKEAGTNQQKQAKKIKKRIRKVLICHKCHCVIDEQYRKTSFQIAFPRLYFIYRKINKKIGNMSQ